MLMADQVKPVRRKRAILYCRVSTEAQKDGESLDFQEDKGQQYAGLHNIEVVTPLREIESGFIHYSYRPKLMLALQMIRDGVADMIIVWDIRRFSRNFVHCAMLFEEIEKYGGEVVSISENIDSTPTGQLVRSILSWGAQNERDKNVEYANRRWQSRLELGITVGTGVAPYGWDWADKGKTGYIINDEESKARLSMFHMFVELDMSIRGITRKLTEDRVLTPLLAKWKKEEKNAEEKEDEEEINYTWATSTVFKFLTDKENIGILTICKRSVIRGEDGKMKRIANQQIQEIPGGIPAIIPDSLYWRAQDKLKRNREEKSGHLREPENFLFAYRGHCEGCGRKMSQTYSHDIPVYRCLNDKCPMRFFVHALRLDTYAWDECCQLFRYLDLVKEKLNDMIQAEATRLLEDTTGKEQMALLAAEIAMAESERDNQVKNSWLYNLIDQEVSKKKRALKDFEEECAKAGPIAILSNGFKKKVEEFRTFLEKMNGDYHTATFQEKRNAIEVIGAEVYGTMIGTPENRGRSEKIEVRFSPAFTGVHPLTPG